MKQLIPVFLNICLGIFLLQSYLSVSYVLIPLQERTETISIQHLTKMKKSKILRYFTTSIPPIPVDRMNEMR